MSPSVPRHPAFLRSVYAETLLENFFVAAIASVLGIRLYLHLTGYPQVGSGEFHIAHVLWGGLLMLIGIVMLLSFLNRSAREVAAVIGGIGFGAFIDELGKFVTSDNDYFFQPAVALIYVIFVLLYLTIRFIGRQQALSEDDCMANAFEITKEASIHGIRSEEQEEALYLLAQCRKDEALTGSLKAILMTARPLHKTGVTFSERLGAYVDARYEYAAQRWWFTGLVVAFFAFVSITSLYTLLAVIQWSIALVMAVGGSILVVGTLFLERQSRLRNLHVGVSVTFIIISMIATWTLFVSLKVQPLSLLNWAAFILPGVSGVITVIGLLLMPVSRLRAYRMFRLSVLVSIFLTQVLAFYQYQFFALIGLLADIVILLALRYMIHHEEAKLNAAQGAG